MKLNDWESLWKPSLMKCNYEFTQVCGQLDAEPRIVESCWHSKDKYERDDVKTSLTLFSLLPPAGDFNMKEIHLDFTQSEQWAASLRHAVTVKSARSHNIAFSVMMLLLLHCAAPVINLQMSLNPTAAVRCWSAHMIFVHESRRDPHVPLWFQHLHINRLWNANILMVMLVKDKRR